MAPHKITKIIHFSYGHRLLDYDGQCRYLHGHNGVLEVDIEADSLDDLGMVVDFSEVRDRVKGWVDANLDHRMVLSRADPILETLTALHEPVYVMDENPTAENIAKHVFENATGEDLEISEIRLWETASSYATYRAPR